MTEQPKETQNGTAADTTPASPTETLYPTMTDDKGDTSADTTPEATPTSSATPPETQTETPEKKAEEPEAKTPEEKKPDESESADEFKPITAEDLSVPEDLQLNEARQGELVDFINEFQIPPAAVAKFMEMNGGWAQEDAQAQVDNWTTTQEQWVEQAQNDPKIGGDQLEGNLNEIGKLLDVMTQVPDGKGGFAADEKYAGELRQAFDMTGAGNHPAIIRFLSDVAKQARVSEGTPLIGGRAAEGKPDPLAVLYPTMQKG